jgi:hypothetical protein
MIASEKNRELTLSDTEGSFPGMLASRIIHVVLLQPGKGIGEEQTTAFFIKAKASRTDRWKALCGWRDSNPHASRR